MKTKISISNFFTTLTNWEYWPLNVFYSPFVFWYLFLSLRAKSFFFFSNVNPSMRASGLLGESKWNIYKLLPTEIYPKTFFINAHAEVNEVIDQFKAAGLNFPVICKPHLGERGWWVEKIDNEMELQAYITQFDNDFLLQEYCTLPLEGAVLYYRFPNEEKGHISSLTFKEMLQIKGDGKSSMQELILAYPRARLQWAVLEKKYAHQLNTILPLGEVKILNTIGNHNRGTKFLNFTPQVDDKLIDFFDALCKKIPDFQFGRFDIKCNSLEELKEGKNFQVMELNGVNAEPVHIYQTGFPILEAYKVLFTQWNNILKISKQNQLKGNKRLKWNQFWTIFKEVKTYKNPKSEKFII